MGAENQLPRPEEIKALDMMIAELDKERGGTTRSYAAVVEEWTRFAAFIALLDAAVRAPFAEGARATLLAAGALVDGTAHALAFALVHAGEAIQHRRSKER